VTVDAAIVDLHGTVYRRDGAVPGAGRGLSALSDAGVETLFFSNNPTRTPGELVDELADCGLSASADRVLTAGVVTVEYLREHHDGDAVFLLGESGLRDQLREFELTGDPRAADVLVVSIDRSISYDRLTAALRAVESGATFLGTDPDRTIPVGPEPAPGSGAVIGAVAATVGRPPDAMLGKPAGPAAAAAVDRIDADPDRCLVVGDRLDTDVALGERIGATTVLVETGIHDRTDRHEHDVDPDHVLESLGEIGDLLE